MCCKVLKTLRGGAFGDIKTFSKKNKNEIFEQSHSAENCKKGEPLGFFNIYSFAKYQKQLKVGSFRDITKFSNNKSYRAERSLIVPNNWKGGSFCFVMVLYFVL